jgi:protein subunit release factor A
MELKEIDLDDLFIDIVSNGHRSFYVRLTHFPTGIIVECDDEDTAVKNKAKAMALLKDKLSKIDFAKIHLDDLRIDTYRNGFRRCSLVRITHLPTGIIVECGDNRTKAKNKAKAMVLLKDKLLFNRYYLV